MPKLNKKTISIFILVVLALYVVINIIPSLTGALTRTEIIEYGKLKVEDSVQCYIVRDETVYTASSFGEMNFLVKEGSLVKKGTRVLNFTKSNESKTEGKSKYKALLDMLGDNVESDITHNSKRKGVLSYYVDGYESKFSPENIDKLTFEEVSKLQIEPKSLKRNSTVEGDPIFKICDNANWYVVCFIEQEDITKYEVGEQVEIDFPKGNITASVDDIKEDGDKWLISLVTNRYYKDFTKKRMLKGNIITTNKTGLIVSNGCLSTKDDVVGVYVKDTTGEYLFKPVQVIVSDGKQSILAETTFYDEKGKLVNTVSVYDEVLKNPKVDKKE